jgi:hypothetical protein
MLLIQDYYDLDSFLKALQWRDMAVSHQAWQYSIWSQQLFNLELANKWRDWKCKFRNENQTDRPLPSKSDCALTALNPTFWGNQGRVTLFLMDRAQLPCQYSQTRFDIVLDASNAHKAALIYPSLYKFALLDNSVLQCPLKMWKSENHWVLTATLWHVHQVRRMCPFFNITRNTPASDTLAILVPSVYQISPQDWKIVGQLDNCCSCRRIYIHLKLCPKRNQWYHFILTN